MSQLTFKSRISLWFTVILAGSLLTSGVIFAVLYFGVSLINLQKFILREGSEIQEKHLVLQNGEVFFKKDEKGKTLPSYLIDEGLSAMIVDNQKKVIGSYGVYHLLLDSTKIDDLVNIKEIEQLKIDGKPVFSIRSLYQNKTYLTALLPIVIDSSMSGVMVIGADLNMGKQMMTFALVLLSLTTTISIALGWLVTRYAIGRSFKPLEKILVKMKRVEVGTLSEKVQIEGNKEDELVKLVSSFNEMLDRLDQGVKKQKEFIVNASHELKTPLTRSILELETINADIEDKNYSKAIVEINKVKDNLKNYGELLHGLLSLARVKEIAKKPVYLKIREYVDEAVTMLCGEIELKKINLVINIDKELEFRIPEEHLRILLNNLLTNAVKYSKDNGEIMITAKKKNRLGYLEISNIKKNQISLDISRLWLRHYRNSTSINDQGFGIGLTVVKEISEFNNLVVKLSEKKGNILSATIGRFKVYPK